MFNKKVKVCIRRSQVHSENGQVGVKIGSHLPCVSLTYSIREDSEGVIACVDSNSNINLCSAPGLIGNAASNERLLLFSLLFTTAGGNIGEKWGINKSFSRKKGSTWATCKAEPWPGGKLPPPLLVSYRQKGNVMLTDAICGHFHNLLC